MKIFKIIAVALIASVAPLSIMWLAPYVGLPRVHIAEILSKAYSGNKVVAAILFLSFRIVLAFVYVLLFNPWEPIKNGVLRGMFFGFFVFLYSEANIVFHLLSRHERPFNAEIFVASSVTVLVGSLIFGAVLGAFFKR